MDGSMCSGWLRIARWMGGNRRGGWVRICGVGGWGWVRWICGNSRVGWVGIGRMDGWE